MENKECSSGNLLPEKDTRIQLVVNNQDTEEDSIDLGRVIQNFKRKSRVFAWVLILCMLVGICAPLLLYQFQKPMATVSSVVTMRYDAPNPEYLEALEQKDEAALKRLPEIAPVSELVTPNGEPLDLSMVTSSPVLQKALSSITLSQPITIENLRNNLTITRVLTEKSSLEKEALSGMTDAKNADVYSRMSKTELKYQNRFIVTLSNGFGDADSKAKKELTADELEILLDRILEEYNNTFAKKWADFRLPEDKVTIVDPESQDLPEALDNLNTALDGLYDYCESRAESVKAYRSSRTGMNLYDWMKAIRLVQDVSIDYLDADVYARGLMRDKETVRLTFRYRIRTLQSDLDKVNATIADNAELLKNYKNNEVYVSMQESDASRSTKVTTDYYNALVLRQQQAFAEAAQLKTRIAETQDKLDRLDSSPDAGDISDALAELENVKTKASEIYIGIWDHMNELFVSPTYVTYSEHSEPQGEEISFLAASAKQMVIGAAAGAVVACGLWLLASLLPELHRKRDEDKPKDDAEGKEAAEA